MLIFRTILLWIAFLLLVLQNFIFFNNITLGLVFRLIPSGILLLWFLLSIFIKERVKIRPDRLSKPTKFFIQLLRPAASITIVLGALFKILHWPLGNQMLIAGIGFMAIYSTILSKVAITTEEHNPDILDDLDD